MRDLFVLPFFLSFLVLTFAAPYVGVLTWAWLTLMYPHTLLWGFLTAVPLNFTVAIIVAIAWMLSREPKRFPTSPLTILLVVFIGVMTLTTIYSLAPDYSWLHWDRNIKVMVLGFVVAILANTPVRVHALIWVAVISLSFYGVTGGIYTIATGGNYLVAGALRSRVGDNNHLALALCMTIPLINYLRLQSRAWWVRLGLVTALVLNVIAVLGTFSRGGFVSLATVAGYFTWKSEKRLLIALIGGIVLFSAVSLMPPKWEARMATISNPMGDESFQLRVQAWTFAVNVALERPFLGVGFNAGQVLDVYRQFLPGRLDIKRAIASHSIYFQVLSDHGIPGFAVYLCMLAVAWWTTFDLVKRTAGQTQWLWMNQLVRMMQVSLLAFCVGGAALSMAYYDLFYIFLGLFVALRAMLVESPSKVQPARFSLPSPRPNVRARPAATR